MEGVMIHRLRLVIKQIEKLIPVALSYCQDLSDINIDQATIVCNKLDVSINRFSTELFEYFRTNTEPDADEVSSFSEVQLKGEEILTELKFKLNTMKEQRKEKTTQPQQTDCQPSNLPKLKLPEFDGNILEFYQFWDQFESNVGSRNISNVDKLLYLKSSLTGNAKEAIDGLNTTNQNYEIAVATLKERFGKRDHIIDAHYAALYRIRKSNKDISDARRTLNEIERHLRVLHSLGEDVNHNHLRFIVIEKFDEDIIYEIKIKMKTDTITEIRDNLERIISAREDASRVIKGIDNERELYTTETLHIAQDRQWNNRFQPSTSRNFNPRFNQVKLNNETNKFGDRSQFKRKPVNDSMREPINKRRKIECVFCSAPHHSSLCNIVKTNEERRQKLIGRCYKCLQRGHIARVCNSREKCSICTRFSHNEAVCPYASSNSTEFTNTFHSNTGSSTVLQTAVVKAIQEGEHIDSKNLGCRVLLDSGSQRTYVTERVVRELNLPILEEVRLSVFTFGAKTPQELNSGVVKLTIQTRTNKILSLFANIVPIISRGIPHPDANLKDWDRTKILADDGSLSPEIDILIGNDYYFTLISTNKIKLGNALFLVESELGWILTGKSDTKQFDDLSAITYLQTVENKLTQPDLPLDNGNIKCLWDLESIGICDPPNANREEEAIKNFNETTELINNRYTVCWPWNEYPPNLPSNIGLAYGRLVNLIKRLDPETLSSYDNMLQEQIRKNIIESVPEEEINIADTHHPVHYLPHHGVTQPGKPIRIVYDASAKTKNNKSLNECLHCGPMLLEDLTGMFLRFRSHQIGIIADVEKAFLQIALHRKDRDVTRFLWLRDCSKPATEDNLLHLRLCRVPFGIITSPFLLNATLRHHLTNHTEKTMKELANDIYVDNLVTGTESIREALKLYQVSKKAFQDISMNLRAWSSNSKEFMNRVTVTDTCKEDNVKVLGLNWCLEQDSIQIRFKTSTNINTKREALKVVASIYDPCGYACAHVLPAKLFIQELWKMKMKWDTTLNTGLRDKWTEIKKELDNIQNITLPRRYFSNADNTSIQLHCFTDSSTIAYAAVVYVTNGKEIGFVIGKSRLVPIKDQDKLGIPRLELLGMLIGSRLIKYVMKNLNLKIKSQFLWTDSQVIIDWYNTTKLLPPFVAKRIDEIRKNGNFTVRYVPTELNTADIATRPFSTVNDKDKWLSGPRFLLEHPDKWPMNRNTETSFLSGEGLSNCQEEPRNQFSSKRTVPQLMEIHQYNEEIQDDSVESNIQKLKDIQKQFFPDEVEGQQTNLSHNLGLFRDVDGILRCKGRLTNTNWLYDKKYPILIPKNCEFTNKMIESIHEKNYHVGTNHTLSLIRNMYWIPQGKAQVQKILRKCTKCIKHGGGPFKLPPTPALPRERVNYSAPFTFTGTDYLGPLYIQTETNNEKRWVCLYTCLAVRAIHLEVVKDLTAEECLLALRRFISTRGIPDVIISDNALQFKLSSEILASTYCINNKIRWKFIPQLAPWHGGFYERLVGIVKHCLKRTISKQLLNETQLTTVIKEIEAIINTRPLTCVGSDIEDILKPSDFLSLGKCIVTESSDHASNLEGSSTKQNIVEGWRRGQNMLNDFKKMFTDQYLPSLRERYQHSHKEPRITHQELPKLGDIVQIKGDTKNRDNWKIGKIISLLKGADGQCRVATVKVGDSEFTRSISHLYPLEVDEDWSVQDADGPVDSLESLDLATPTGMPATPLSEGVVSEVACTRPGLEDSESTDLQRDVYHNEPQTEPEPEQVAESTEIYNDDRRETRDASVRARERIREWTRHLRDLY